MSSLLPDVNIVDAMKDHGTGLEEAAAERYTKSVGRAHLGLTRLAHKAAGRHDDKTTASNAAADLLDRFSDSIEQNGDDIVSSLAIQHSSLAPAAQTLELENAQRRASDAESQVRTLTVQAREVSTMRDQVAAAETEAATATRQKRDAESKSTRLQQELDQANTRIREFEEAASKPNPLSAENGRLKAENSDLKRKLEAVTAELEALKTSPAEPDNQSGEDTSMIGGIEGEEQPAEGNNPRRGGWFSRLPGHHRQGGEV